MTLAPDRRRGLVIVLSLALALFVVGSLGYGAWFGFPVQDDTYMIRLLRLGGPDRIVSEHPDRPVYGVLLAAGARLGGERRAAYVAIGVAGWLLLAGEAIWLWLLLFPEWSSAWPAVGLAVVAPVVACVQFSTLTTLLPCVLPVMLVLLGVLLFLRVSAHDVGWGLGLAAFLLTLAATVLSEYGLATAAAAMAFLILLGRWRSSAWFGAGAAIGYLAFRALGVLSVRKETDPHLQLVGLLSRPWTRPFRVASAAWSAIVGAWGGAASKIQVDWASKSTLLAAVLGVGVASAAVAVWALRRDQPDVPSAGRRLLALGAGVVAGLYPAITIMGWPMRLIFETRYLLPALVFASCATVALALALARPRRAAAAIFLIAFLAGNALVLRAFEERKLQRLLEAAGRRLESYVGDQSGLVVLVAPDRLGQSKEEVMAKATYRWSFPQASRVLLMRQGDALLRFGPRSGCRPLASVTAWPQVIRWPRAEEPVRVVLWDSGDMESFDPEPYFRGCPSP
jgi:hypothetical protein